MLSLLVAMALPGLCKRCVMMLQCKPVIGPTGRHFFLGIDMSMGCSDDGMSLDSSVGTAAFVLLVVTILIPVYGADRWLRSGLRSAVKSDSLCSSGRTDISVVVPTPGRDMGRRYLAIGLTYFKRQGHKNKKYPDGVVTKENAKEGEEIGERISMLDCEDPNYPVKKTFGQHMCAAGCPRILRD